MIASANKQGGERKALLNHLFENGGRIATGSTSRPLTHGQRPKELASNRGASRVRHFGGQASCIGVL
jgi:hypothetical protein